MQKWEYKVIFFGADQNFVFEPSHMQELLNRAGMEGFELHALKKMPNKWCEKQVSWYAFLKKPFNEKT
jgi:hypothetical protein